MVLMPKAWVVNPWVDLGLFVFTPLILAIGFQMLAVAAILPALKIAILGISSTGHHLPGIIRAYTDPSIFRRFRYRLVLVPSLFILLAGICAYYRLGYILFAVIVWSIWHGSMQIMGFLRIYDVKSGFHSRITASLDFWICMTWFVQVILWSQGRMGGVLSAFYLAGGPLLPIGPVQFFSDAWLILTWVITAAYLANLLFNGFRGYWNIPKLTTLVFSLVFWAYCMIGVQNILIGLIMWEIFHDLQYNVFVWKYNQTRVARGLSQSPIERFLFQANTKTLFIYAGCIILYGCLGLLSRDISNIYQHLDVNDSMLSRLGNVFAASALIHFYFDGFIWKVRDQKVRQDMGLEGGGSEFMNRSNLLHIAMVTVFLGVGIAMAATEYRWQHTPGGRGEPDNLADLVPGSGYANFMKASRLKAENKPDSAFIYYERAMAADTAYSFCHAYLGEIEYNRKNYASALKHFEMALKDETEVTDLHENLAVLYLHTGNYEKARITFEALQANDSLNANYPYQIGFSLLQMRKGISARPYLLRSLSLNPNQPLALNYLGMVEQSMGNLEVAHSLYQKSLAVDPEYDHAKSNLSDLEKILGK